MRPVTQLPVADALAASAHGLTEQQWRRLPDHTKQDLRWTLTSGQNYKGN